MTFRGAWFGLVLVVGCSGRMVGGVDGGAGEPDAQMEDAAMQPDDAGLADAGQDAAMVDAGTPDAGPPPCACPPFPAACTEPAANAPTFTPGAEAMAGQLFDVIACAETTLQIAMYEAEWACIGEALDAALARNPALTIQVVTDDDNCALGSCLFDELGERVEVVRDERSGYMHHKWIVADGERVWLGSANFSERSFCIDHNNAIIVEQPDIVDAYEASFAAMLGGNFAPAAREPITAPGYALYFSPDSPTTTPADWQTAILAAIEDASARIDVFINAWTVEAFANALIAAHDRGVEVRVLVSHLYASDAPAQLALAGGIDVRRANIHDKTIVVDGVVFTGSANWSVNARTNSENVLMIEDAAVAAAYRARFDAQHAGAEAVTP